MADLARRTGASARALEQLATAGACRSLIGPGTAEAGVAGNGRATDASSGDPAATDGHRRRALWAAGAVGGQGDDRLPGLEVGVDAPPLEPMTPPEVTAADLQATGISPTSFPIEHLRDALAADGVRTTADLAEVAHGCTVRVAGVVTHRQQPATAGGTVFVNLEDETGMANVICQPRVWAAHRKVAMASPALVVTGRVERSGASISLVARRLVPLRLTAPTTSRNFR
jgi:error-prone DNA polymerase